MRDKRKQSIGIGALSFAIPVILLLIAYAVLSIFPFGDKSLIVYWDMREQYTVFFEYLKTIFSGENNIFYTFSKFLGGDMIGLFAYYLSSPFNILFLLLKNVDMAVMILLLTLLKTGLCGLTFNVYLSKRFGTAYTTLIFSTLYALSAYSIIYQQNIMWLDGMILLPLVMFGIEKLVESNKILCYVISLAVLIISNYYMGYMMGIFVVFYFTYVLLMNMAELDKKMLFKKVRLFLFATITSVGSSAMLLLPTLLSLRGGKGPGAVAESSLLNVKNYTSFEYGPIDFLFRLFPGSFEWQDVMQGLPFVFCGLSTLVLVILFFFNHKISKREKLVSGGFLFFLILSYSIYFLNIIWHGMNFPTGFPGRNSFVVIAIMLIMAYRCFLSLREGTTVFHIVCTSAILFAITFVVFVVRYEYYSFANILVPFIVICATVALITLFVIKKDDKSQKLMIAGLAFICSLDLVANACMSLGKYHYETMNDYKDYYEKYTEVYDYIEEQDDDEFYRIEKDFRRVTNDAMMFNNSGLTSYSSCEKMDVKAFGEKLGLNIFSTTYAGYGEGSTMAMDCFLGVKYFLSHEDDNESYEMVNTINDTNIYINEYALPLGFMSSDAVKDIDIPMDSAVNQEIEEIKELDDIEKKEGAMNRFEIQNQIFYALTGGEDQILYPHSAELKRKTSNMDISKRNGYQVFERVDFDQAATIEYTFTVESEDPIYIDIYSPVQNGAYLIIDGEVIENYFSTDDRDNIISLGSQPVGKEISIVIDLSDKVEELTKKEKEAGQKERLQAVVLDSVDVYYEDIDSVKETCTELLKQPFEFERLSSSHLKGSVNSLEDNQTLFLTVPYEEAWKVEVDGVEVEPEQVCDVLMAVDIPKGEHTVELTYVPDGLYVGIGVSIGSVFLLLGYFIVNKKKGN